MCVEKKEDNIGSQEKSLCTKCGTCIAVSDQVADYDNLIETSYPRFRDTISVSDVQNIRKYCPGRGVDFKKIIEGKYHNTDIDCFLGPYKKIYISHVLDPDIRRKCSSGGLLSMILIHLLETNQIDGCIGLKMDVKEPWRPVTAILNTKEEIISAAQSKYIISSTNKILKESKRFQGRLAYVGLPCQVHAINKLQLDRSEIVRNIRFVFGPFCGNALQFESIKGLLLSYGVCDYKDIKKLEFRAGEWPGNLRIELRSNKVIELPKFYANYLIPFYMFKRCLKCPDLTNELTDVSGGDAWAPIYEERGKGFSLLIIRSDAGMKIVQELEDCRKIYLEEIDCASAKRMHAHAYDLKKTGFSIRKRYCSFFKRPYPKYVFSKEIGNYISYKRQVYEIINIMLLYIMSAKMFRALISLIPPKLLGEIFLFLRKKWKKHAIRASALSK